MGEWRQIEKAGKMVALQPPVTLRRGHIDAKHLGCSCLLLLQNRYP